MLLGRHSNILNVTVLQELLHDATLHDVTDQKQGSILLEVAFGLEIVQEFLEPTLLSLTQSVHFVHQDCPSIGCRWMNERRDTLFRQQREDCLTKRGSCAGMRGVKFLNPVFGDLTDSVDHGGFADPWTPN